MRYNQDQILRLLDELYELPVNDCRRFVDLMLCEDEALMDLAQAYREHRITRHTYGQGVLDRISDYFREELNQAQQRRAN